MALEYDVNILDCINSGTNLICLEDLFKSEKIFIQLFDDWTEQVCKLRFKEVAIKYENGQYTIETKSE